MTGLSKHQEAWSAYEARGRTGLRPCYSIAALAREMNLSRHALRRILLAGEVKCKRGRVWISDLRREMPEFLDSWAELQHQRAMRRAG